MHNSKTDFLLEVKLPPFLKSCHLHHTVTAMQLEKRKASTVTRMDAEVPNNQFSVSHRHGYPPPTCTPASHTPLSHFDGRGNATPQHRSTDTPLSMYAMHRAKYKMTVLSSILAPTEASQTVQVYYTRYFNIKHNKRVCTEHVVSSHS